MAEKSALKLPISRLVIGKNRITLEGNWSCFPFCWFEVVLKHVFFSKQWRVCFPVTNLLPFLGTNKKSEVRHVTCRISSVLLIEGIPHHRIGTWYFEFWGGFSLQSFWWCLPFLFRRWKCKIVCPHFGFQRF